MLIHQAWQAFSFISCFSLYFFCQWKVAKQALESFEKGNREKGNKFSSTSDRVVAHPGNLECLEKSGNNIIPWKNVVVFSVENADFTMMIIHSLLL